MLVYTVASACTFFQKVELTTGICFPLLYHIPPLFSTEQGVTACGTEAEANLRWLSGSRKLRVKGGGCVDMSRIMTYLTNNQITDVLSQVSYMKLRERRHYRADISLTGAPSDPTVGR